MSVLAISVALAAAPVAGSPIHGQPAIRQQASFERDADDDDKPVAKPRRKATRRDSDGDDDDDKPRAKPRSRVAPPPPVDNDEQEAQSAAASPAPATPDTDDPRAALAVVMPAPVRGEASAPGPAQPVDHAGAATAQREPDHDDDGDDDEGHSQPASEIVVSARALDAARTQIDAGLGSTTYSLTNETIENRPGGETGSLASILAQAPGVATTGNGLVVRGSAANQIRINNVIVPEAVSDPAEHISARFAETTRLLTGTLPAQFAFAPAGVISVTTKNGLYQHGGEAELFGGTDGSWEPALEWAGSVARTSLFGSANYEHNRYTVADALGRAARDDRGELEGLGFADHVIGANDRISLLAGGTDERDHIGATTLPAGTEHSGDGYAVGTYQHTAAGFTVQASLFAAAASNDARFTASSHERRTTLGTQIDASDEVSATHTLRLGLLAAQSTVHELEANGSRTHAERTAVALYAQDEWKITPELTFNPGLRAEWLRGLGSAAAIEPRASVVWQTAGGFSAHAGYSRFATAPELGDRGGALSLGDERDDYADIGVQQRAGPITLGIDGYKRWAHNFLAEHAVIGSATPTGVAFQDARFSGVEFSATYARRGTSAWANLSLVRAEGRSLAGPAGVFAPATIVAAADHFVRLGSDRPLIVSTGATQRLGHLSLSSQLQVSSGAVWTSDLARPNGERHATYAELGVAAVYHARILGPRTDFRLDATDLTNARAVTADATALEGGWTRRLEGRAVSLGVEQAF